VSCRLNFCVNLSFYGQ